ncbi:MAG: bacillithiol biosynthesis deacetylase BshB1 [Planctomycetaceae bacterium]|nr:bacillithiol biosynthesis deacetylase BshB1 [Planctomycetaceae bacterium]
MTPLDVLVISPHPDDAEISVGGTILKCRAEGMRVGVLDLTTGEPTPHGTLEIRAAETETATRLLDLSWRHNLGLPNRSLLPTLEARRALAGVLRTTRPRFVFAPYWEDVHPDHVSASRLADDARFWAKLSRSDLPGDPYWPPRMYYFWSIHLRIHPKPSFVLDVTPHIERKMEAISAYASQFTTGRTPTFPTPLDDIRDRARYWGWSIGTGYAEPFACREEVGLMSLNVLG